MTLAIDADSGTTDVLLHNLVLARKSTSAHKFFPTGPAAHSAKGQRVRDGEAETGLSLTFETKRRINRSNRIFPDFRPKSREKNVQLFFQFLPIE
jgi:hypothetical protein